MEEWIYWLILLGVFIIFVVTGFFYIVASKWINFGIKYFLKKNSLQQNLGFMWIRDSGNNFDLPKIIDLRVQKKQLGVDTFLYAREQLLGANFLGKPFVMFDNDDNKTSLGLYFQESNPETAEPMYYIDPKGNAYTDASGNKMPMLSQIKPSTTAHQVTLLQCYHKKALKK